MLFGIYPSVNFCVISPNWMKRQRLDGCSYWGFCENSKLPNSKTVMFVVALFCFCGDLPFLALIYLNDKEKYTLAVGCHAEGISVLYPGIWGIIDAGRLLAVIPTFILWLTHKDIV